MKVHIEGTEKQCKEWYKKTAEFRAEMGIDFPITTKVIKKENKCEP